MDSEIFPEPANDCPAYALDRLEPLAPPERPLFFLQLAEPLERALVLTWECDDFARNGVVRLPAGEKNLLSALPEDFTDLGLLRAIEISVSAAFLEEPDSDDLEPLEIWRRFATFSLWSDAGQRISFAGSHAGAANENALFVTVDNHRVSVDFENLVRLRLRRRGAAEHEQMTLVIAPCLCSAPTP